MKLPTNKALGDRRRPQKVGLADAGAADAAVPSVRLSIAIERFVAVAGSSEQPQGLKFEPLLFPPDGRRYYQKPGRK